MSDNIKLVEFKSKQKQQEEKLDAAVKDAIEACYASIDVSEARGLLTIVLDTEGNPEIFFAGAMEPFKVIGVLELAKSLFVSMAAEGTTEEYEGGDYDDTN